MGLIGEPTLKPPKPKTPQGAAFVAVQANWRGLLSPREHWDTEVLPSWAEAESDPEGPIKGFLRAYLVKGLLRAYYSFLEGTLEVY